MLDPIAPVPSHPFDSVSNRAPESNRDPERGSWRRGSRAPGLLATLTVASLVGACGQSSPPTEQLGGEPGAQVLASDGTVHVVAPNLGGNASQLGVERIVWGRLVDLFDQNPFTGARTLRHADLLVAPAAPLGADWELTTNVLTGREELTVHHAFGSSSYDDVLAELEDGLLELDPKSANPGTLPPWTAVPRNAALAVEFNDLLDPATLDTTTVQLRVGYPPVTPFEARVFADPNHGALVELAGETVFRSTRVIVDNALSVGDVALSGEPLEVNPAGLPAASVLNQPNLILRIPTQTAPEVGQFTRLANLAGKSLAESEPALLDEDSPTLDVVRAARSGGPAVVTFDADNGFLPDATPPRLLGVLPVTVFHAEPLGPGGTTWSLDLAFGDLACAVGPEIGDVVRVGASALRVSQPSAAPADGIAMGVRADVLPGFAAPQSNPAVGDLLRVYRDGDAPPCFLRYSLAQSGVPGLGVSPESELSLLFDEPLDPDSARPFEGFLVTRVPSAPAPDEIVVGRVLGTPGLASFTFRPSLPLDHQAGTAEEYWLQSPATLTDLAGNPLSNPLPATAFQLDPTAPTRRTGGTVLRFATLDEDGNGLPELRGQFVYDEQGERLRPRAVTHFSQVVDKNQPLQALMQPIPHPTIPSPYDNGIRDPLNPLGSRVMTAWRYADLDLPVGDEATHNVDVEGMHWVPRSGAVTADQFSRFEMRLSHSTRLPDEAADLATATAYAPNSGLTAGTFDENVLADPESPVKVVHPMGAGYTLDPTEVFQSATGTTMMPFPMNRGVSQSNYKYFTWRDTSVQAVGGEDSLGIDLGAWFTEGSLATIDEAGFWAPGGSVPSVGLPLLIDLLCGPDLGALGTNQFDFLLGGFPTTFGFDLPANSRVFSSGGSGAGGEPVTKEPLLESIPTGGFNQDVTFGALGSPTPPTDSIFYLGQLDLVTRTSRAHTIWFDSGGNNPSYADVVLAADVPPGTALDVDLRGAVSVLGEPLADAGILDAYGDERAIGTIDGQYAPLDAKNPGIAFQQGTAWSAGEAELDGARYFQLRLSFLGDAASGVTPALDAIGVAYELE